MIINISGINGLGRTKGCEENGDYFKFSEKLKLNNGDILDQLKSILDESKNYFDLNERVLFLGGDHSISFPLVNNFYEKFLEETKLLIFDAHPDLVKPMPEPGHEEWLRAVMDKGFNPKNILIVGVRKNSENIDILEINYAKEKGVEIIYSDEIEEKKKEIFKFVSSGKIYCSLDIDVLDSDVFPCTGYLEKQGLSEEQFIFILNEISSKIQFFDLVEVNLTKGSEKEKENCLEIIRKIFDVLKV